MWRTIPVGAAARAGLGVGRELDRPLARELARALRRSGALAIAGRALRARDHSARSLEERLARRDVPPAARAEAVAALEAVGVVDDVRFAAGRAAALAERGWGDAAIRSDLERRGVAPETAAGAVAALDAEPARAAAVVARHGRSLATARRLAAHGFEQDSVEAALGGLIAGEG